MLHHIKKPFLRVLTAAIITLVLFAGCSSPAGTSSDPEAAENNVSIENEQPAVNEASEEDKTEKELSEEPEEEAGETEETEEEKTGEEPEETAEQPETADVQKTEPGSASVSKPAQPASRAASPGSSGTSGSSKPKNSQPAASAPASSGSASSSGNKPKDKVWVEPVYQTVYHEEEGHYETVQVQKVKCKCGIVFDTAAEHKAHQDAFIESERIRLNDPTFTCNGTHTARYITVDEQVYVVDKEAYSEEILVTEGHWE